MSLKSEIVALKREKNNIEIEFKNYQINTNTQIDKMKIINQDLNNYNYNIYQNIKNDKDEILKKIKDDVKIQINKNENNKILEVIIENWKREKQNYLKDLDDLENKHLEEIKDLENKIILSNKRINELNNEISYKDIQLLEIQKKIDKINMTYQILENNNNKLLNENNQLKIEGEDLKNSLNVLKNLVQQREEEFLDNQKFYENNIKNLKDELNQYKNKLDNKEKENKELQNNYNKVKEEKTTLIDKINNIKDENELNSLYLKGDKNKNNKNDYEVEKCMYDKDEEIKSLNKYINKIKQEYYKDLDKKNYYKEQCKIFNYKIDIIKNNLTQQQIQNIEKEIKEKDFNINEKNKK